MQTAERICRLCRYGPGKSGFRSAASEGGILVGRRVYPERHFGGYPDCSESGGDPGGTGNVQSGKI